MARVRVHRVTDPICLAQTRGGARGVWWGGIAENFLDISDSLARIWSRVALTSSLAFLVWAHCGVLRPTLAGITAPQNDAYQPPRSLS